MISDDMDLQKPENVSNDDPDMWLLDRLLTKDELRMLLSFKKKRTVKLTIDQLAKRNNMSVEEATEMAEHICEIGLMEYDRENKKREKQYFVPKWVVGSGEYMMMNGKLLEEHPEVATFFHYASMVPVGKHSDIAPPGGGGLGMHVIPVEKAIEANPEAVPVEKLSHWLSKYDKFCLDVCSCRRQQRYRGEGAGDIEDYYCIAVGDMAEFLVETKKDARYCTYEEVLEVLDRSEKSGFVHQITNLDGGDKIVGVCNCSNTTCNALKTSQLFNTPNMSASAYRAHVAKDKCVACGKCVEVCPVGAAKLGQKLCKKDGSEVTYPVMELPDDIKWGPHKWNKNYREDAKINCYDTGTSPCKAACPANLSVQGYIKMADEGRYRDALELIKQDNPLPAVCGDICNRRCEDRCTRGTIDEPVAIDEIKKFIAAQELKAENRFVPECCNEIGAQWGDEYKLAVIGAGPGGLSAAYYLRKRGYPVTVFEREAGLGGMLKYGVPSFRLEKDVLDAEIEVMKTMGVEFRCGVEVGKDVTFEELREQGYKAFYVAVGLQSGGALGVPGDAANGVESGISFLRRINADEVALKQNRIPEGAKLNGKVVIIGGGNIGSDVARTAIRAGAESVDLYALEGYDELPMGEEDRSDCEAEGIRIHGGWGPVRVSADAYGNCHSITFRKCLSVRNEEGRFAPTFDDETTETASCTTVLYCIGQKPDLKEMFAGTKVTFNPNGTIIADPVTLQTAEEDIFAGGDIVTGQKFAIDAIGVGRAIADSLHRYVHKEQGANRLLVGRDLREIIEINRDDILVESYDTIARQKPGRKPGDPVMTFADLRAPFTEAQIRAEANRCLKCGATTVDTNRCIGCGLCTTRCEFDAIKLERDMPQNSRMFTAEEGKLKAIVPYALKRIVKIKARERAEAKAAGRSAGIRIRKAENK
ncbi:MAG: FAD-dependent oxidoreductase [Mogibacterium sp.]|nr:FAD-dependent oxidoreductase [Mogibacterium sp.]